MKGKRGLTAGQIILMVLAVLVLAFLVYGLVTGTVPFFGSIENFGGGQVNVQQVVQSCQISCTTQSVFDYCGRVRGVIFEKGGEKLTYTCKTLEGPEYGLSVCNNIDSSLCNPPDGFEAGAELNPKKSDDKEAEENSDEV